jgi:hypothetical protein
MDFTQLAIGGVLLIPLIIGIVRVIKKAGVVGNALMYWAIGISMIIGLLYKLSIMFPVTQQWVELVIFVVAFGLVGLSATGLYDLSKDLAAIAQASQITVTNAAPQLSYVQMQSIVDTLKGGVAGVAASAVESKQKPPIA